MTSVPDHSSLLPAGFLRCYITPSILRKDTPEEHVRQRVARSLVEEYGYAKADIEVEFPIKVGSGPRKRVDLAIFPPLADHVQETISIIAETKREDIRPTDRKEGVAQLKSYLAACMNARWGLWVGSEMQAFEKEIDPSKARLQPFLDATDIPLKGQAEPRRKRFADLVPATDGLSIVFRRCHNYLHVNANLTKEQAFFELLKLIFCKVHDEDATEGVMEFSIAQEERRSELGQRKLRQRIDQLFESVKERYPYIFPVKTERILLDNRSLAYVVQELEKYNFQGTQSDIKGEAYEEIVGVTSRRDQGAFFTPRTVCDMAVSMVFATYPKRQRLQLRVIDPACGTGGFLRAALLQWRTLIDEQMRRKWSGDKDKAAQDAATRLRAICDGHLFGIDKLAELVRAAQMNLAMHGDGSSNVFHANSLVPPGEWPEGGSNDVRNEVLPGSFDVVFTNPPFGSRLPIDDPHILEQYQLARFEARTPRGSMPPEQLFVERCLQLLRPGGRMAIVLPDSILSNPGLSFIRRWLLLNAFVIAVVDLPREMFAKSDTHTMTSVVVLQRFSDNERRAAVATGRPPEYEVFMAIADKVGWDLRGNAVYVRTPEGEEILREIRRTTTTRTATGEVMETVVSESAPILDDHLPVIAGLFREWLLSHGPHPWQ